MWGLGSLGTSSSADLTLVRRKLQKSFSHLTVPRITLLIFTWNIRIWCTFFYWCLFWEQASIRTTSANLNKNVLYYWEFDNLRPWGSCLKKTLFILSPTLFASAGAVFFKVAFLQKPLPTLSLSARAVLKKNSMTFLKTLSQLWLCVQDTFFKIFFLWRFFKKLSQLCLWVRELQQDGRLVGSCRPHVARDGTKPFFNQRWEKNIF